MIGVSSVGKSLFSSSSWSSSSLRGGGGGGGGGDDLSLAAVTRDPPKLAFAGLDADVLEEFWDGCGVPSAAQPPSGRSIAGREQQHHGSGSSEEEEWLERWSRIDRRTRVELVHGLADRFGEFVDELEVYLSKVAAQAREEAGLDKTWPVPGPVLRRALVVAPPLVTVVSSGRILVELEFRSAVHRLLTHAVATFHLCTSRSEDTSGGGGGGSGGGCEKGTSPRRRVTMLWVGERAFPASAGARVPMLVRSLEVRRAVAVDNKQQ